MCHVYVRGDQLAGALISDHEYPHRVAHTLLNKVKFLPRKFIKLHQIIARLFITLLINDKYDLIFQ